MKNTKITKIALLVLSAALLLGTVIGFTVGAEAPEYEIIAKNVIYGERTAIAFAVNATVEEATAGAVKVAYKWGENGEVKNATLLETTVEENICEIDGKTYPVFAAAGVPAKELGNVLWATVYTGDAPAEDANWITYSAAEYFYSRLYRNGFINKTAADGKDYNRRLMYEAQLQLSANAQVVLNHQADKPVDKYSYVYTTSELVNFNGAKTVFGYGDLQVNATVVGEGTLVGWTLTAVDGTETELKTVILTANGIYKAEPVFGVHECADENKDHLCDSCSEKTSDCSTKDGNHLCDLCGKVASACADADKNGQCDVCFMYNFNVESMKQSEQLNIYNVAWNGKDTTVADNFSSTTTLTTSQDRPSGFGSGEWFTIAKNPTDAADSVLQFNSIYKSGNTEQSHITFAPTVAVENGDLVVFEFDFYHVSGASGKNPIRFYDIYADGTASVDYTPTYTNAGNVAVSIGTTKPTFAKETWVRYRLVYNNSNDTIYWYYSVDGGEIYKFAGTNAYKAESDIVAVGFRGGNVWNGNSTLLFDNIKCVKTTAEAYGITLN